MRSRRPRPRRVLLAAIAAFTSIAAPSEAFGDWSGVAPLDPVNSSGTLDGCPFPSPDGKQLYIASNRAGSIGGIDIWVSERPNRHAPWGQPVNLGAPVNSAQDDFCPSPGRGGRLMFVSRRPGGCGSTGDADIYRTRFVPGTGWREPSNLGCVVNSPADDFGPVRTRGALYFSSSRGGTQDIYAAPAFGPWLGAPEPVTELNTATKQEARPFVSLDGREIVFDVQAPSAAPDIWRATRRGPWGPWSTPAPLDGPVNTAAPETRPSLSPDGHTLYFGRGAGPTQDVYTATR